MKKILAVAAALVLALALPGAAFAAGGNGSGGGNGGGGGNGSGGGNGGGSNDPLVVVSASIEDGAVVGELDSITLVFSKNVCDAGVREANQGLAQVTDSEGNAVAVNIVLADDQVEPDKRNDMVFEFELPLEAGDYTLTAQAGITAKSGDSLAEDFVLHFTIGDAEATEGADDASADAAAASDASASADAAAASDASASAASSSEASSAASGESAPAQQGVDVVAIVIGAIIVIVLIGGIVVLRK